MYLGRCSIRSGRSLGHHVLLGHVVPILSCLIVLSLVVSVGIEKDSEEVG